LLPELDHLVAIHFESLTTDESDYVKILVKIIRGSVAYACALEKILKLFGVCDRDCEQKEEASNDYVGHVFHVECGGIFGFGLSA
jgi:hypothetical protein